MDSLFFAKGAKTDGLFLDVRNSRRVAMDRKVLATAAIVLLAGASAWAQKGGGGGVGGAGGGVKGGTGGTGGGSGTPGVPGLPNDKFYSKEGCAWVEPYAKAADAAKADDKFF